MSRFWVCLLPAVILALGLALASRAMMNRSNGPISKMTQPPAAVDPADAGAVD